MSEDDGGWRSRYDASIAREEAGQKFEPLSGIGGRFWGSIAAGFLAALWWLLTSEDPLLAGLMVTVLGAVLLVGLMLLVRSRRGPRGVAASAEVE